MHGDKILRLYLNIFIDAIYSGMEYHRSKLFLEKVKNNLQIHNFIQKLYLTEETWKTSVKTRRTEYEIDYI